MHWVLQTSIDRADTSSWESENDNLAIQLGYVRVADLREAGAGLT